MRRLAWAVAAGLALTALQLFRGSVDLDPTWSELDAVNPIDISVAVDDSLSLVVVMMNGQTATFTRDQWLPSDDP